MKQKITSLHSIMVIVAAIFLSMVLFSHMPYLEESIKVVMINLVMILAVLFAMMYDKNQKAACTSCYVTRWKVYFILSAFYAAICLMAFTYNAYAFATAALMTIICQNTLLAFIGNKEKEALQKRS